MRFTSYFKMLRCVNANLAGRVVATRFATEAGSNGALKPFEDIPGPSSLPYIGSILHILPYIGSLPAQNSYVLMKAMHMKYGNIVKLGAVMSKPPMVFCYDPEHTENLLRTENVMPLRPGFESLKYFRKELKKEEYGGSSGLITEQGEPWKEFRSKVNQVMMQPKTIKLYAPIIDEVAQDTVNRLKKIRNDQNMITEDFEIEMNKWALESIAVVGLGGRIGCLRDDLPKDSDARQIIQCVRDSFVILEKLDFRPSPWKYFSTPTFRKGMKIFEKQLRLSQIQMNKAIDGFKQRKAAAGGDVRAEDKSILEKLLEIDPKVAILMASDMLFAGVDTAAHTMISILYLLAKNPEAQKKLRDEVTSVPNSERRPYLKACIKETMRLSPVVSGNLRRTTKEHKVGDYLIPKGIDVIFPHEYLSRQESQYARAEEFIPERWLVGKEHPLHYAGRAHPMTTLPFGYGVRSCIGRRIAELEIETFLGRMVENFEVEYAGAPPTVVTKSLNYYVGPLNFIFRDIK